MTLPKEDYNLSPVRNGPAFSFDKSKLKAKLEVLQ